MTSTSRAAVVVLLLASTASAASLDGRWDVVIERKGWQPETAQARLTLGKDGKAWRGTITFRVLMNGQRLTLEDIGVKGTKVSFRIPRLDYELEGKVSKGKLAGVCTTSKGQRFSWTGERYEAKPADLYEKGLRAAKDLPRGDAKKLGVDVDSLHDLVNAASEADTDALLVVKGGRTVCERTFGGELEPIPTMSVTKFVTGLAVGALLEDGKIASLDAPVSTWFPDWAEGEKARVTLGHLVTHTSGLRHAKTARALNHAKDRVTYARGAPVEEPGTVWSYNNDATALLSGVIEEAAGKPLDAYVQERLFDRMGIERPRWNRDEAGHTVSYAELWLDMRDLARVGLLVANKGTVGKKTVLSPETIELLCAQQTPLSKSQGVLFFRILDEEERCIGVRHDGWLGQHLVVLPDAGIVAVRMRHGRKGEGREFGMGDFTGRITTLAD